MTRIIAGIFLALGFINPVIAEGMDLNYPYSFKMMGNPLVSHISSTDPDAHVWDGTVWVYCSQDHQMREGEKDTYIHMDGYHAFSSKDLVNWTDHGEIMHSRDIVWGREGFMWAPGAARKNGKYYLYYPHKDKAEKWRVGVAIGDTPAGPFKDIGKPIDGLWGIDPAVFIDDDGSAYIYCNDGVVAKLNSNMIELAEKPRKIIYGPDQVMNDDLLRFNEGAYMHKKDGVYYFSYTNWKNKQHQGYYAIADNPYGPFTWKGPMAEKPIGGGQDHHSIIKFQDQWYYFYHFSGNPYKPKGWKGERRLLCFDKLYYNNDGTIQMVKQTRR